MKREDRARELSRIVASLRALTLEDVDRKDMRYNTMWEQRMELTRRRVELMHEPTISDDIMDNG